MTNDWIRDRCRPLVVGLTAVTLAAGVALMVAAAVTGCRRGGGAAGSASDRPVADDGRPHILVIGVDGLEWNVVLPLIRAGRMPNLEKLMERGSFGKLRTLAPTKSPVIWTTIATGFGPEGHGILDFMRPGAGGKKVLYTSRDRKTKALWNILTDAGRTMDVIGWWNTFPTEAINGVMVSQANSMEQIRKRRLLKPGGMVRGVEGQVYPPSRQAEMWGIVEEVDRELPSVLRGIFGDTGEVQSRLNRANWEASKWSVRADESYRRIALKLASERPLPDCFAVYFGMTDVVGHRFWRFQEPDVFAYPPTADAIKKFGHVIKDSYAWADKSIGELVARFPPETTVFVMSDHGMHAYNRSSRFVPGAYGKVEVESGAHKDAPPGLLVVAGPQIRKTDLGRPVTALRKEDLSEIASVDDITPTILAMMDIPLGRDMDGRVLEHLFRPDFAERLKVKYVATHNTPQWLASRGIKPQATPGADERIEQLRSLGYLGGGPEEQRGGDKAEPTTAPASGRSEGP